MNIADIESAIMERLKEKITTLSVEAFPENPSEYKVVQPKGVILIRFERGRYEDTETMGIIVQRRLLQFQIVVILRNLRSHEGVYSYLDAVRISLTGFKPTGCKKMRPVEEGFLDEADGLWSYQLTVETETMNVEVSEEEQGPLLKRLILENEIYGDVIVESIEN